MDSLAQFRSAPLTSENRTQLLCTWVAKVLMGSLQHCLFLPWESLEPGSMTFLHFGLAGWYFSGYLWFPRVRDYGTITLRVFPYGRGISGFLLGGFFLWSCGRFFDWDDPLSLALGTFGWSSGPWISACGMVSR